MDAHRFQPTAGSKSPCSVCGKTRNAKAHKDAIDLVDPAPAETYGVTADNAPPQSSRYADPQVDTGMTEDEEDAAIAEDEIAAEDEPWGIPPVPPFQRDPAPAATHSASVWSAAAKAIAKKDAEDDTRTNEQVEADAAQAEHDTVDADNKAEAEARAEKPKTGARRIPADAIGSFWIGWRVAEAAARGTDSLAAKVQAAKPTQLRYYRVHLTLPEIKALDAIAEKFEEPGNTGYAIRAARTLRVEIAKILKGQS